MDMQTEALKKEEGRRKKGGEREKVREKVKKKCIVPEKERVAA